MNYKVKIDKLDNYGRGICFIDNKITFIENALPNEEVEISLTKTTSKYNEGKVIKYLNTCNRIEPMCSKYEKCGGCHLMHMTYTDELKFKEQKVKDILYKYGHVDTNKVKKIISNDKLNYRNKAIFKVNKEIGYYKEKTNELVPIDNCFLVDDRINNILKEIKRIDLSNINEVEIKVSELEEMIIFKGDKIDIKELPFKNILLNEKVLKGNNYIIYPLDKYKFYISPKSFFQINKYNLVNLYNKVKEYVGESNNLLDLYCGTGSIGIYLSDICKKITGIEINESAVMDANKNKELNHLDNINFICLDVSKYKLENDYDTIIVDPPRSGLSKEVISYLLNSYSNKIIYVSCDPVTLARDLNLLQEKYNVIEVTPIDMFPRTYHVECICLLMKK